MEPRRTSIADRLLPDCTGTRGRSRPPAGDCSQSCGARVIGPLRENRRMPSALHGVGLLVLVLASASCLADEDRPQPGANSIAKVVGVHWSAPDVDRDGLKDWLQLDIHLQVPKGAMCSGGGTGLEQGLSDGSVRHLASGQHLEWLRARGQLNSPAWLEPWAEADSAGRCTLSVGFDGDSLRNRASDGRWIAQVKLSWRMPDDRSRGAGTYGTIEQELRTPRERALSFGRAPLKGLLPSPPRERH
jgi:hypothetical protein